ncbi:MAG: helix-turn-helix domain-containing protein [Nitratireductor sp.]|nr:helix-turn-helix domain-containing protein [Nitratireductor sp.]
MNIKKAFGLRVRTLRTQKRLTQEKLSEKIGRSVDSLSLIERGENWPTAETIERLANALDIELSDLFDGLAFGDQQNSEDLFFEAREILRRLSKEDLPLATDLLRAMEKRIKNTKS